MKLVIDSSVALKWFLAESPGEQDVDKASQVPEDLGSGAHVAVQPVHFTIEVLAVLARVASKRLPSALQRFAELSIPVVSTETSLDRALALSVELGQHLFDTLYHAVALETGAVFVTSDDRYLKVASGHGGIMRLTDWAR